MTEFGVITKTKSWGLSPQFPCRFWVFVLAMLLFLTCLGIPLCIVLLVREVRRNVHGLQEDAKASRSDWTLQQYTQTIIDSVTNRNPGEGSGLEANQGYIRILGQEIDRKFGFSGMQEVWNAIHGAMGPGPCSDLTRIWDGVGQWQK